MKPVQLAEVTKDPADRPLTGLRQFLRSTLPRLRHIVRTISLKIHSVMVPLLPRKRRAQQHGHVAEQIPVHPASANSALPDFAIWPALGHLSSADLGKAARVSKWFFDSLSHPAFLPILLEQRQQVLGVSSNLTTLAHLHLAEQVGLRQPLRLVFNVCCCEVPAEEEQGLKTLIDLVKLHPTATVELEGHTTHGPPHLMEHYSRGRADSVAKMLGSFGLKNRLSVSWFRDERLHPDYPMGMHPEHRRVEVFVALGSVRFKI